MTQQISAALLPLGPCEGHLFSKSLQWNFRCNKQGKITKVNNSCTYCITELLVATTAWHLFSNCCFSFPYVPTPDIGVGGTLLPKNLDPKVSNWLRNCSLSSMPSSCMMWTYYLQRICVRSMAAHLLMAMQYIWHQSGRALI